MHTQQMCCDSAYHITASLRSPQYALHVYNEVMSVGQKYGIRNAGYYALRSLRIEKFFAFWGQDLDSFTTPLECGREFRVKFDKVRLAPFLPPTECEDSVVWNQADFTKLLFQAQRVPLLHQLGLSFPENNRRLHLISLMESLFLKMSESCCCSPQSAVQ